MACIFLNSFTTRLQRLVGLKSKSPGKNEKRAPLQISAPFNFKRESVILPGLSEDELFALKAKVLASVPHSGGNANDGNAFSSPRKAPCPGAPQQPLTPAVVDAGKTPSPEDKENVI